MTQTLGLASRDFQEEAAANETRLAELENYYTRLLRLPELQQRSTLPDLLLWLSTHGSATVVDVPIPPVASQILTETTSNDARPEVLASR